MYRNGDRTAIVTDEQAGATGRRGRCAIDRLTCADPRMPAALQLEVERMGQVPQESPAPRLRRCDDLGDATLTWPQ